MFGTEEGGCSFSTVPLINLLLRSSSRTVPKAVIEMEGIRAHAVHKRPANSRRDGRTLSSQNSGLSTVSLHNTLVSLLQAAAGSLCVV